jgi:asparagine synthase (glutamine-hydrolysing)
MAIIPELNGMFAFAYYDKKKRELLISRDRMGIKPLYYTAFDRLFFFASEIKTVLHLLEHCTGYSRRSDLSREFIADIIVSGHAEFNRMPFQTIHELPAGTSLKVTPEGTFSQPIRYYSVIDSITAGHSSFIRTAGCHETVGRLEQLLSESVRLHLISDAPVGVLCSGGVDSSLITAMTVESGNPINIYHATADDGPGELPFAEMVAKRYKLPLTTITMTAELFIDSLVDCIYHLDMPLYHPSDISLYAISQKAHTQGIKVLLCGEGADELFGGYGWHSLYRQTVRHYKFISKVSGAMNLAFRALKLFRHSDYFTPEEFFLYSGNYLTYTNHNLPTFAKRNALLRNRNAWSLLRELRIAYSGIDSSPDLAAFITSNLFGHLATLLQRNDRMCMKASIESRVPFIENNIIDFALNLDSSYKLHGMTGKYIVKKCAEKYLPHRVIYRKKGGFPVPWYDYVKKIDPRLFTNGFIADYLDLSSEDIAFWSRSDVNLLFTAVSLEIWGRLFVLRENATDIKALLR